MDEAYRKLTKHMREEISYEDDIDGFENDIEKLKKLISERKKLIRGSREKGAALLKGLTRFQSQYSETAAPAGKAPAAKKHLTKITCGINGCTFSALPTGMSAHRRACKGREGPCPKCKTVLDKPSRQREHNNKCQIGEDPVYQASPPISMPIFASAAAIDRISPTGGLGELEITSSSIAL